jgi:hypothetical protein
MKPWSVENLVRQMFGRLLDTSGSFFFFFLFFNGNSFEDHVRAACMKPLHIGPHAVITSDSLRTYDLIRLVCYLPSNLTQPWSPRDSAS